MKTRKTSPDAACSPRSTCPIACTLDLLGDKWTLLVVRDLLFVEKRLYGELAQAPEKIPTSILADRLKRLEQAGLVEARPYQSNPVRYEYRLTPRGVDLHVVLDAMLQWGSQHIPGTATLPKRFRENADRQIAAAKKKRTGARRIREGA